MGAGNSRQCGWEPLNRKLARWARTGNMLGIVRVNMGLHDLRLDPLNTVKLSIHTRCSHAGIPFRDIYLKLIGYLYTHIYNYVHCVVYGRSVYTLL